MSTAQDAYDLLRTIRNNLANAQAAVADLTAVLNELQLKDKTRATCPQCGVSFKGPSALAEHQYLSHDGDVPEHWLAAETHAALEEATP